MLADGQPWLIRRPTWICYPRFNDKRVIELAKQIGYSCDVEELIGALPDADSETLTPLVATIAAKLLLKVYDLTERELDSLLHFKAGDPALMKWVTDVVSVVTYPESTLPPAETTEAASGRLNYHTIICL